MELNQSLITHLFIDLDGTLVNSLPSLKYVYDDFLNDHQRKGSEEEFSQLKTSSIEKLIDYFKHNYILNHPSLKLKKQYESYLEKHYFKAPLFTGAKTFLKKAKQEGLSIILTTASQKLFAKKILELHQIETYFEAIMTPTCLATKTKETAFYLGTLEQLKLKKESVLVLDDSLEVIACATEIGLHALLFSKINYHPLPCFGSWKSLTKQWFANAEKKSASI
ncbi:MAG: Phosphoglycolate phosphatase [Chlamydiae bacterium]|nr:Phosphoglycolate phosphatase [Chlamydiota bacterium]